MFSNPLIFLGSYSFSVFSLSVYMSPFVAVYISSRLAKLSDLSLLIWTVDFQGALSTPRIRALSRA